MNRPPPLGRVEAVVSHAVPHVTVQSLLPLQPTAAGGLQRLFRVTLSDDRTLLLKLPPSLMLRLLRRERYLTWSEPCVINWIFRETLEGSRAEIPRIPLQRFVTPDSPEGFTSLQTTNMVNMDQEVSSATCGDTLLSYLPAVIASSTSREALGAPFSLWEPAMGDLVSSLPGPLTPLERRVVEYQKGYLVRQISQVCAPNSRFGPAVAVLGPGRLWGLPMPPASAGLESVATWSTAFLALMESILRDAEDVALMINYSLIRRHLARLSYTLDDVTESRLVLFDAANDANVLVTRSSREEQLEDGLPRHSHKGQATAMQGAIDAAETNPISVTGLQDWSNCVFGDPLMVKAFSRNPSDDFLRGFRGQPPGHPSSSTARTPRDIQPTSTSLPPTPMNTPPPPCIIAPGGATAAAAGGGGGGGDEKGENRCHCYHATAGVVKQFYRPSPPQSRQCGTAARRRLTEVLAKLEQIQRGPAGTNRSNNSSSSISISSSSSSGGGGGGGGSSSDGRRPKSRRTNDGSGDDGAGWPKERARSKTGD
ncbi:hypothetical protein PG988_001094 [Apiospora saccharicola]